MKSVTAAIIVRDGNVLICRRAPGEKLAGFWEFPGGKQEPGESLQECLERELHEELDVEARAGEITARSRYLYDHGEIELIGIRTELLTESIRLTVHDNYAWVKQSELSSYKLAPADILLAERLAGNPSDLN